MALLINSIKFIELILILLKLFQKLEEEGILSNSFYKVSITLMSKPNKNITRKKKIQAKSLSLLNKNSKILNKILANQTQNYIKVHTPQSSGIYFCDTKMVQHLQITLHTALTK